MEYLIVGWIVCAILSHGLSFAYLQKKSRPLARRWYWKDMAFSIFMAAAFGPANLLIVAGMTFPFRFGVKYF